MRQFFLLAAFLLVTVALYADENQAFLGMFAETSSMKTVGMPGLPPGMEDIDPKILEMMPGMANNPMFGPQRKLNVRLWSPNIAPKDAVATLVPPKGLKLPAKLQLELYRPEPGKVENGEFDPDQIEDFTIKNYWGSSATVKPGQPDIFRWDGLTEEQQAVMRAEANKASKKQSYFYKENWTTGYWPTGKQPGAIAKNASLVGKYALTTNYTGNVELTVPDTVEFLAAIEMSSPNLGEKIPFDKEIIFQWKPIPGILGYNAMIIGMQGKNTLITWSSSEIKTGMGVQWDYLEMAEVAAFVASTAMMAPDRTEVIVPAGIFQDCDTVMFMMTGYGPGAAIDKAQPLPRMQTKTTLQIMMGGKMMDEMHNMDREEDAGDN